VVMMGALSTKLPFDVSRWEQAVRDCSPGDSMDVNLKAFELGRAAL